MIDTLDLDYKPKLPQKKDYGIAIVGAGVIVEAAHLPAYQKSGFEVRGIWNHRPERAERVAKQFGLARVYRSLEEIMNDPSVDIIDIAVPATEQLRIVRELAPARKHFMLQKPIAEEIGAAMEIARLGRENGVKMAVNQNGRWSPAIRAARTLVQRGMLGEPVWGTIQIAIRIDWFDWSWLPTRPRLALMYANIHVLDALRSIFGEPSTIYASLGRYPWQKELGETVVQAMVRWPNGFCVQLLDTFLNRYDDQLTSFRFEGSEGYLRGSLGIFMNYPHGAADSLEFASEKLPGYVYQPKLEGRWIPDGFSGTMGELMRAIEEGRDPENNVEDNLATIRLMLAGYASAAENRPVDPREIKP